MDVIEDASEFLRSNRDLGHEVREKHENDFVTTADGKCEEMIRSRIRASFPDDSFLGEEYGEEGESRDRWIIDPIDGTVNYMNGFPDYTISIAFERDGVTEFGLVSVPAQNELFSAVRGCGASLNGRSIHISDLPASKGLCLAVPPHRVHEHLDGYLERMRGIYDIYSDVRSIGSAALSLCYVASGRCSAYWERFIYTYDIAAGVIIAEEAGARITIWQDGERLDVLATSPGEHERMMEIARP